MSSKPVTIDEINNLSCADFTRTFGNVVENYGTAALLISSQNFHNIMDVYCAFCNILDSTDTYRKEKILKDNPGLGSHLIELVDLFAEEKYRLTHLIEEYELKFGFSFVICTNENKILDILKAITRRLKNNRNIEICIGMEELKKISKYRILQAIKHEYA